jgi:hypothetical protein
VMSDVERLAAIRSALEYIEGPAKAWGYGATVTGALEHLEAVEATLRRVRELHPTRRMQSGSVTHGGPPQYRNGCSNHGLDCRTWQLIQALEGSTT